MNDHLASPRKASQLHIERHACMVLLCCVIIYFKASGRQIDVHSMTSMSEHQV